MVISGVRFLNMGLKAFVFTKAEQEQRLNYKQPPVPRSVERLEDLSEEGAVSEETISKKEKQQIEQWLTDYQQWKEEKEKIDPITSRRHREASLNLAMILIGLPLYLYHWGVIKKETRSKKDKKYNKN